MKLPEHQGLRYLLVGTANTAIGYALFGLAYLALDGRCPYVLILALAHVAAVSISFLTHGHLVFRRIGGTLAHTLQAWWRYQLSYLGLLALGIVVNGAALRWLSPSPWLAQAVAMSVNIFVGYHLHRRVVFRVRT
ncbi:MAG: GtrA family protein [Pseudomonadota bacterium]